MKGNFKAISQILKIEERRAKLLGLDNPPQLYARFEGMLDFFSDEQLEMIAIGKKPKLYPFVK